MVSEPPLEEPNCVLLIVTALGVQTPAGKEKIGCSSEVEGGKELKHGVSKRIAQSQGTSTENKKKILCC
jgi:hypothetical protein